MARTGFDFPGDFQIVDDQKFIQPVWGSWFTRAHNAVASLYQSGTTAQRPTDGLWIGRRFYDKTLGKPIWVHSVNPAVWHDASGAVV